MNKREHAFPNQSSVQALTKLLTRILHDLFNFLTDRTVGNHFHSGFQKRERGLKEHGHQFANKSRDGVLVVFVDASEGIQLSIEETDHAGVDGEPVALPDHC